MLPVVTIEARLVEDPELKFTPSGVATARLRLVAQDRTRNDDGKWEDNPDRILWINAICWRDMAEHVGESLSKGDLVMVTGKLRTNSWEDREGNKRSVIEVADAEVGASLRFRSFPHRAAAEQAERYQQATQGAQAAPGGLQPGQTTRQQGQQGQQQDPWTSAEPPF